MNAREQGKRGVASGEALAHESAHLHVSGRAHYIDDLPLPANSLHLALGQSRVAHGRIRSLDLAPVLAADGVVGVLTARDVPGENNYGGVVHDDPIFADDEVQYVGQPLFAVMATSYQAARRGAALARVEVDELPAILGIREALAQRSFVLPSVHLARGDVDGAMASAPFTLEGSFRIGGQEHFYLESNVALALPQDDGSMLIHSSTQNATEVQHVVAHALGVPVNQVVVQCRRMGGGFGGKESQPALFAAAAAIGASKSGRAVKLRPDRETDMTMTGKRHDFEVDYRVGFDERGVIVALDLVLASRCGYSADLSGPVNDRAMFHVDNCYYLENLRVVSHRCKTHTVSNTAFRGFGGPQGMMAIEAVIDAIARHRKSDPLEVRRRNFYGTVERNVTHYGMTIEDNIIAGITAQLMRSSDYAARREAIAAANADSPVIKRGLALMPVKFGISFTATHLNQAGALVNVYTDGSVRINHGGLEMGQGLHTKVIQVVADELGVATDAIRICATDTSKVPNTSPTAASSGTDLNAKAAQAAARTVRERIARFLATKFALAEDVIRFAGGQVFAGERTMSFGEAARLAWQGRVSLSSTGYYATPKIRYDPKTMQGRPFFYFAYGAAVSEVAIDTLTGEYRLLRVDILHDVGHSLNPAIDIGQIEGGFLQGVGWLTCEELWWDDRGALRTRAPSTYKIPTAGDWPQHADVRLLEHAENREDTIFRSKAVGEPPLMLALSVFHALRDAVTAAAGDTAALRLMAPATPEAILTALGVGADAEGGARVPTPAPLPEAT